MERSKRLPKLLISGILAPIVPWLPSPVGIGMLEPDMRPSNAGKSMFRDSKSVADATSLLNVNDCPDCVMMGKPNCVAIRLADVQAVIAARHMAAIVKTRMLLLSIVYPPHRHVGHAKINT